MKGMEVGDIARALNVSLRTVQRDVSELEPGAAKVAEIIEDAGLDADDIHITLSKMHDADISDIMEFSPCLEHAKDTPCACTPTEGRTWTGYYIAPHRWPAIWRQGLAGKVKVTPVAIPDGERTPGGDLIGYKVEIERESLLKILDLSARLKAVDALQQQKSGDTNINLTITAQQQRLERANKRLERVIDVKPEATE